MVEFHFDRLLNHNNTFIRRDMPDKSVRHGRLACARSTGYENVFALVNSRRTSL